MLNSGSVKVIFSVLFGTTHHADERIQDIIVFNATSFFSLLQSLVNYIAEKVHHSLEMNSHSLPNPLRVKLPKQRKIVSQVWLPNFLYHAPDSLLEVSDRVRTSLIGQMFHSEESRGQQVE